MSLGQAQRAINEVGGQLKMTTAKFDDDEGGKPQGVKEIVLGGKKSKSKNKSTNIFDRVLRPPQLEVHVPKAERKVWHPVVWQQSTSGPVVDAPGYGEDAPHKRIIRNIRRLLTETEDDQATRSKHIENMLLALPTGSGHLERKQKEDDKKAAQEAANGNSGNCGNGGDPNQQDDDFDWFASDVEFPDPTPPAPEPPKPKATKKKSKKKSRKNSKVEVDEDDEEEESD